MLSLKAAAVVEKSRKYLVPAVAPYYKEPLVLEKGEGRWIEDINGQRYLDFYAGILTNSIGYAHPKVIEAIETQIHKLMHTSTLYLNQPMVDFAEELVSIAPEGLQRCFFTPSGTEADETAVLMARLFSGRREIVTLRHSYSGHSAITMSMTGQAPWKLGMEDAPAVIHTQTAYCYRCPFGRTPQTCALECAKDLEDVLQTSTTGRPAALIVEPIQGNGGFIDPPAAFFQEVAETIRRHGGVFIADEVQTGFGRTGRMWGIDESGVTPDMITFAKGVANGLPAAGVVARTEIAEAFQGPAISTFGGNPVAMEAAKATLQVIEDESLVNHAREMGDLLKEALLALQERYPAMGDVRGRGLMQAIEFVREQKVEAPDLTAEFMEKAKEEGLLVGKGGLHNNVVRLAPPLTITSSELQEGVQRIAGALAKLYADHSELKEGKNGAYTKA